MFTLRNTWLHQCAFLFVLLAVGCVGANAQAKQTISVTEVRKEGDHIIIQIKFATPLRKEDQDAAKLALNYSILDTVQKKYLEVCSGGDCAAPRILFPGDDPSRRPNLVELRVKEPITLEVEPSSGDYVQDTNRYHVQSERQTVEGKPVKDTLLALLPVKAEEAAGAGSDESDYEATTDRDESNIYIGGELTRASGTDFNVTADVKIEEPIKHLDFWGTSHELAPIFDIIVSSDPKADPDTLKFGGSLDSQVIGTKGRTQGVFWKNEGAFEAERDFDNVNLTWGSRFTWALRPWQDRRAEKVLFYVRPFIETELGKNLKSPVAEADGGTIARVVAGSSLNLRFPFRKFDKDGAFSLAAIYERRWPLKREVSFEENDDGALKAVTFGTNPRDWVDAKFIFTVNKFFGPFIGYQYGSQPPSFKLVDHQMKIGFLISVKQK
jgi:hypothetical protein